MVASPTNLLLVCEKEAIKMINNSKLDVIENNFNNMFDKDYKMIFITKKEWDKYLKSFDKDKKYKYIKDDKYINNNDSKSLAEYLFGDDVVGGSLERNTEWIDDLASKITAAGGGQPMHITFQIGDDVVVE